MRATPPLHRAAVAAGLIVACGRTPADPCVAPARAAASGAATTSAAPQPSPSAAATMAPSAATASPPLAPPPPDPPPAPFMDAMVVAEKAIDDGDFVRADHRLDDAAAAAGTDSHLLYVVARYRATRFTYSGD